MSIGPLNDKPLGLVLNKPSDTPRTDLKFASVPDGADVVVILLNHARQLEREQNRLLSILNDRSDCDQDTDGTWLPNEANSILSEYQGWLDGWVK